jgi:hypothetical protein
LRVLRHRRQIVDAARADADDFGFGRCGWRELPRVVVVVLRRPCVTLTLPMDCSAPALLEANMAQNKKHAALSASRAWLRHYARRAPHLLAGSSTGSRSRMGVRNESFHRLDARTLRSDRPMTLHLFGGWWGVVPHSLMGCLLCNGLFSLIN